MKPYLPELVILTVIGIIVTICFVFMFAGCANWPKRYTMSFDKDCIYSYVRPSPGMPLGCWCTKEFNDGKPVHTPVHKMRCNR